MISWFTIDGACAYAEFVLLQNFAESDFSLIHVLIAL